MVARDPDEAHRSATSLELLYDLAFVVSFARRVSNSHTCSPKDTSAKV
jgi:low temperature requirement protein LtrA